MKLRFLLFIVAFFASYSGFSQIAAWDFTGESNVSTSTAEIYTGMDASPLLTRGTGAASSAGSDSFRTVGFQNNGISVANTDYFQCTLSAATGSTLSLTTIDAKFDGTSSFYANPGVSSQFAYSLDNITYTLIGAPVQTTSLTLPQIDLTGIAALQNVNATTTIYLRYYASGRTPTGGWGFSSQASGIYGLAIGGSVVTPQVDYCNLQFPGSAVVDFGTPVTFYARAYEPGVTDAVGQGAGIAAWIGYSSTNNNPNSAGWTWVPATYNVDVINDDEYKADLNAPVGVYYVASRFKLATGGFTYGGYTSTGGGFWSATNVSAQYVVNDNTTVDFCNLQTPASGPLVLGGNFDIYAQVYEPGVTPGAASQGLGISAWIGYSSANTDPSSAGWTWIPANFNALGGGANNDEYAINIGQNITAAGTYYYASRFQLDAGAYRYGGILASGTNGGFWDGTTYKSGVLTVTPPPIPEIYVQSSTGGGIDDGSVTYFGFNNTSFGTTAIGSQILKDFKIGNSGTGTILLTGTPRVMISGANASEFVVSVIPALSSLGAGVSTTFQIRFIPTGSGDRFATVTIINNDSDENPYDFAIKGTGTCPTYVNTLAPNYGPVGTEVTVTATSGNLTGATASFNGIAASVTQISATVIKVIVPAGATSGTLLTTNSQGCTVSTYYTVTNNVINGCAGTSNTRNKLFISEVTDHGSGSHSYVEIFNATGATVNIQNYTIRIHNNGATTATSTITLPNFNLLNNRAYVVAFGGTDATSNPGGIVPNLTNSSSGINDNDNVRLYSNSGTWLDLWGNTSNAVFTIADKDYIYRRKNLGITAPSTTWNPNDWEAFTPVNYTNVGLYDFSSGVPPTVTMQPSYTGTCKSLTLTVAGTKGFTNPAPLVFEWYYILPNATTWNPVPNSGVFSGANTSVLTISNVTGLDDYQFYCQIKEYTSTCSAATNAVKIPTGLTVTWNGSAWSPASGPTPSSIVLIDGNYDTTVNGSFDACSVTVKSVANTTPVALTITANNYVSIENDLTVNALGAVHVLDDGSLVMINDGGAVINNGGVMDVERETSAFSKFDYVYWSSPIVNATLATFVGWRTDYSFFFNTANFRDFAPVDGFDDNGDDWQHIVGSLAPGRGYAIMAPTTLPSYPTKAKVLFSGKFNNGLQTYTLGMNALPTTGLTDFNLVGNPYPSAISADDFITNNLAFAGALYFWTHRAPIASGTTGPDAYNFVTDDYATYTYLGLAATGTSGSATGSLAPSGLIASGQGFFIEALTGGTINFNNSLRRKTYNNSDFYRNASPQALEPSGNSMDRIWLNMTNDAGLFSQQLIGYVPQATLDFDRGYDGIVSKSSNTISFYSFIGDDEYRIQGRPAFETSDVVPLGFSSKFAGQFKIAIDNKEGQLNNPETPIYLEDNLLNIVHDLKQSDYVFTTEVGTFNNRFVLKYADSNLGTIDYENAQNNVVVAVSDGQIRIKSYNENIKDVVVYDITGRQVFQKNNVSDKEFTVADAVLSHQALVVKITLDNGQTVNRKIVF